MTGRSSSRFRPGYSTVITKRRKGRNPIRQRDPQQTLQAGEHGGLFRPPATYNFLFRNEIPDEAKQPQGETHATTPLINPLDWATTSSSVASNSIPEPRDFILGKGFSSENFDLHQTENGYGLGPRLSSNEVEKSEPSFESWNSKPTLLGPLPEADIDERLVKSQGWTSGPAVMRDKGFSTSLKAVERCGESLGRFLTKCPGHSKTVEEFKEYERCSAKVNQGLSLNSAEKSRLNQIARNIERRELKIATDAAVIHPKRNLPILRPELVSTEKNIASLGAENCASVEHPPTSTAVETKMELEGTNEEQDFILEISSEAGEESEVDLEDVSDHDDDQNDEQCDAQRESFWKYHVYMTDTGESTDPMLLTTYLSKAKAEARVNKEITGALSRSKLEDRIYVEMRCVFSNGEVQGQSLEFPSGRIVQVQIDRELVDGPLPKNQRKKLEYFPTKLYIVTEDVVPLATNPSSGPADNCDIAQLPRRTQGREAFVLWKHANEQASREYLAYIVNHLPDEQKFDFKVTGNIDTEEKLHLHQLEEAERLYERKKVLVNKVGQRFQVSVKVVEVLVRGPRN